jgi:hypothetical protein
MPYASMCGSGTVKPTLGGEPMIEPESPLPHGLSGYHAANAQHGCVASLAGWPWALARQLGEWRVDLDEVEGDDVIRRRGAGRGLGTAAGSITSDGISTRSRASRHTSTWTQKWTPNAATSPNASDALDEEGRRCLIRATQTDAAGWTDGGQELEGLLAMTREVTMRWDPGVLSPHVNAHLVKELSVKPPRCSGRTVIGTPDPAA